MYRVDRSDKMNNKYELQWRAFQGTEWKTSVNVSKFIEENYTEYTGDDSFLTGITEKTKIVLDKVELLIAEELKKGVLDIEVKKVSGINSFEPGYIDKDNEVIVGLQTDAPLKRIVNPYGGMRMVNQALEAYGYVLK